MLFSIPSVLALLLALGVNAESFNEKLCKADSSKKLAALEPTVYKMLSLHNWFVLLRTRFLKLKNELNADG